MESFRDITIDVHSLIVTIISMKLHFPDVNYSTHTINSLENEIRFGVMRTIRRTMTELTASDYCYQSGYSDNQHNERVKKDLEFNCWRSKNLYNSPSTSQMEQQDIDLNQIEIILRRAKKNTINEVSYLFSVNNSERRDENEISDQESDISSEELLDEDSKGESDEEYWNQSTDTSREIEHYSEDNRYWTYVWVNRVLNRNIGPREQLTRTTRQFVRANMPLSLNEYPRANDYVLTEDGSVLHIVYLSHKYGGSMKYTPWVLNNNTFASCYIYCLDDESGHYKKMPYFYKVPVGSMRAKIEVSHQFFKLRVARITKHYPGSSIMIEHLKLYQLKNIMKYRYGIESTSNQRNVLVRNGENAAFKNNQSTGYMPRLGGR
eukprot:TRINITY_DN622_c0_g1_i17.p1 TRINITY_DN622_c0_g1~~TRINITY_DN622_c0_g1_i17.p1  ORF type:complete len:377 (+),score=61.43 TRINITY_DN622_c0_g1_i17:2425-3555(+)